MRRLALWLGPAPEPGAHLLGHGDAETGRWPDGAAGWRCVWHGLEAVRRAIAVGEPRPAMSWEGGFPEPVSMLQDAWRLGMEAAKSTSQAPCLHAPLIYKGLAVDASFWGWFWVRHVCI